MSSGQIIGGVVGAVAGFFVGGPYGAAVGFAVGLAAGGLLDPPKGPTVQGPTIQDTAVQTSTYGVPIPRVYGTIGGAGNILWVENNQLKATVRKKKSSGGKGGGSSATTKTVTYSATFILGLCEGPIAGVRRIWCSDKLIYNAGSNDLETIIASNQNAAGFRIYLGTDNQMPDPRYEADAGVGNTPAFRGLAYIAFDDFQLADFSNTLQAAQFKVEVMKAASSVGFRSIVDVQSGIQYKTNSIAGVGRPYIRRALETSTLTVPSGNRFRHSGSGAGATWGVADPNDVLPEASGTAYRVGHLSDGSLLSAKITDLTYADGADIIRTAGLITTTHTLGIPDTEKTNKKIVGITCSGDGNHILVALISDSLTIFSNNPAKAFVLTSEFEFVSEYTISSIGIFNTIGAGRAAQFHFGASCLSDDLTTLYFAYGAGVRQFDKHSLAGGVITLAQTLWGALVSGGAFSHPSIIENDKIIYIAAGSAFYLFIDSELSTAQTVLLSDIIEAEVDLSTLLTSADIDTSSLTSTVRGYRVSGGALRAAMEPLQGAFPFDIRESGYGLKCVPRGQASVQTIPEADLGATDADTPGDSILQSREMDSQLPARTVISYFDSAREYAISEQYAERLNTEAINRVDRDLPLVLTANEAAGVAEVLQFLPWLERTEAAFTLPPVYLSLEPADVVTVTTTAATYELRLTEINYAPDGRLECKARPNRAALYSPNALGGEGVAPAGTIGLAGASEYELLDIPVVDEGLQDAPGLSVAMTGLTTAWPGGVLFRSADEGQTWTDLQAFPFKGTFGTTSAPMPARSGSLLDRGSSLIVSLLSGTLESITESAMLNGANFAAYGANGRWEIIRFANATLNGDGTYTLSVFWRGDRGTEQYTGTHATGDTFVLLDDPDNAFIGYPTALIGSPQTYRAITTGASIDSDSDLAFTYAGVNLECYSGVHPKGIRDTSLNLTISWKRRTRVGGEWRDSVDASLGETTEAYEVDILNGATVVRTVTSTTPSVSYTAAQQTTDFGSAQASVLVRIYQLSSVVGRGYPLEATL